MSEQPTAAAAIDDLLERSSSTDIPLLLRAKEEAKRLVKDDPSATNLAALDRANRMLRDAMTQQAGSKNFQDVAAVLAHLTDEGRKVSQSQIYKDVKRGFLRREKDRTFTKRNVDVYASTLQVTSLPERETDELQILAKDELQEKVARLREQREDMAFDRAVKQGKFIRRDDVSLELASRAAALDIGLRSVFQLMAPEYVKLVGGDTGKTQELIDAFEKQLDAALTEYSRPMEFRVEFVDEESGATGVASGVGKDPPQGAEEDGPGAERED
ncbi:MAG: hypothetical protein LBP61_01250 [Desulfovibrio sp.]|jgi:hypothetical protein|nr:hypothetical protein [Desulfovibrio sp.]